MSLSKDNPPDPLVASVLRTTGGAPASGCPDAELLGLYAEQELPGGEHAAIEAHVAGCGRCQATIAAFVRSAPEQVSAPAGIGLPDSSWWAGWRWMVPIASATAVVAVAVWIGRGPENAVTEQNQMAQATEPVATPEAGARSGALDEARAPEVPPAADEQKVAPQPSSPATNAAVLAEEARRLADATAPPAGASAGATFRAAAPAAKAEAGRVGAVREADAARAAESVTAPAAAAPRDERARQDTLAKAVPPPPPLASVPARAAAAPAAAGSPDAAPTAQRETMAAVLARETRMPALTGTVTYRTREALPAGAVIEVRLLDVSRADAPAVTLARAEIVTEGEQVPVPFTLRYAAGQVQPRRRYSVEATISIEGRVAWRTTTTYPVFVEGAATTRLDVVVDPVR